MLPDVDDLLLLVIAIGVLFITGYVAYTMGRTAGMVHGYASCVRETMYVIHEVLVHADETTDDVPERSGDRQSDVEHG